MPKSSMIRSATLEMDLHVLLARAIECGLGDFFEQDVSLAIEHLVTCRIAAWPMHEPSGSCRYHPARETERPRGGR